ncbi:S8 family serine peptidase [Micromonospora narathiwatensis]|uniref:Peptidase inhibitor I9 n=1 Tax=Micromonospora narathiwatensis TaxID=299146 RepID=A0A1A9AAP1_9ACTN|nr:S8 family serine peptidase [Micromonospora narathiwatensis]SBT53264.1 Peptidase inhibitor I9 [Micromonospora narathiwatensis]
MTRPGALRRSALAGVALASVTSIVCAATSGTAMADPSNPHRTQVRGADTTDVVPDRYIVVLKDRKANPGKVRASASALAEAHGGSVRRVFTEALNGYSASMNRRQADRLAADPDVAYVEPVRRYKATGTQSNPPWNLDRIDQTTAKLNGSYNYPNTGAGVTAYIVDSGIDISHPDFGGRASNGYDFVDNDEVAQDCDGHGTHVAGTVGGTKYGVAKDVNLVAVRVLDCEGSGTTEQVLAGIDWVTANAVKPAVANMSLGVPKIDKPVNDAVARSIASGVTYAVASGNSDKDACGFSPAAVPAALTVGATDQLDFRAWFSNYGRCVDTLAPGVNVVSTAPGGGTALMSGTSMASPHVAGAAALLLQANPTWTPQQVHDSIVTTGIAGAVHDPMGSTDRLLHVGPVQVARSSYGLKAKINNKYATAESAGTKPLITRGTALGPWEKYDVVDAGAGLVALKAKINNKYVTAESAGTKPLIARGTAIGAWEKFQLINNTDGTVSLKANINGKYVTAESAGTKPLIARGTSIGAWEKFDFDAPAPVVSIKSQANGKYVTAESAGTKPLIARSATVGAWEKYEVVNVKDGIFGLRATINGKYVTAESAGTKPLIARGTSIGSWEALAFLDYNPDGSVYLWANANGKAVTAGSAGTSQLIASKTINWNSATLGLGVGEKFVFTVL